MGENYCILCKNIQTTGFNNNKGIFEHYCPIKQKPVNIITPSCETFEKKEKTNDFEISQITIKKPSIIQRITGKIL
jgi:hypothetical protein